MSFFPSTKAELTSPLTSFGDFRTTELHPIIQANFSTTVSNTDVCQHTLVNTGTVTQATGMAVIGSGTTTGSTARLASTKPCKYREGLGGLMRFTALFTSPVAGTEQYVGLGDEAGTSKFLKNGYTIGYTGTTFEIQRWQNDVLVQQIAQSSWDDKLDGTGASGMTVDFTKLNVWAINYQYLGGGNIFFSVENKATGRFVQFHNLQYAGAFTVPSTYNPNFKVQMWVNNGATTSNMILKCASYAYFVEGHTEITEIHQPQFSTGFQTKSTVTTEVAIVTIKNKTTYPTAAPLTNFISILLERWVANIDNNGATNVAVLRLVKNATLGGTPSYTDINATNSLVSYDTAGTTVTGGTTLASGSLTGKNDSFAEDLRGYNILLAPGDTLTIAGSSANSATIQSSLLWKELI